jgi:nucleolin
MDDEEKHVEEVDVVEGEEKQKRKRKRTRKKRRKDEDEEEEERADGEEKKGEEEESTSEPTYTEDDLTLYVEGISFDAREDDLEAFFSNAGCQVASIRFPFTQDGRRPLGYAHIVTESKDDLDKGLVLSGATMMGRFLNIQQAKLKGQARSQTRSAVPEHPAGCRTVFIKNLPYDVTEEEVREAVMVCGKIKEVRLAYWRHTGRQKGFCYVEFKREESARIAVNKSGKLEVNGRPMYVDYEVKQPKMGYRKQGESQYWQKTQKRGK